MIRDRLFTAVVGDVLDVMGHRRQFLPRPIKPLVAGTKLVGRAMPALEADHLPASGNNPLSGVPFGLLFKALNARFSPVAGTRRQQSSLFGGRGP